MLETLIFKFQPLFSDVLLVLYLLSPIFFPFFLGYIAWNLWMGYKRFFFVTKQDRILLELKLPSEIKKTPLAMELFLGAIHQPGGEGTWYDRNILGKSRTWFSLEMASIEGQVKFFIWTEKRFKNLIEAQLYAQYPEVEIYEVPDYTQFVKLDLNEKSMWGNEFILTKKVDAYPIKTYVDYGLGREGMKDEEKTDPITPLIEFLGSVGKGEQLWIQIMARAHKGGKTGWEGEDWSKMAVKEKESLLEKLKPEEGSFPRIATKGEQEVLNSIERNIDKPAFDVGIRGIYISDKDKFNPINITGLTGTFKQFNSTSLNGFRPVKMPAFNYPWQDFKGTKAKEIKEELFAHYKRRAYFYWPNKAEKQIVLSSEELATIYHLPGGVAQTPTFSRITSKKSEPPVNLPFQ